MRFVLVILGFFGILSHLSAQVTNRENYDLKSSKDREAACKDIFYVLKTLPPELRFSTRITDDSVYLSFPDQEWFTKIIQSKNDGIAIDLLQKEQFYPCDNISRFPTSWSHKGFLMRPLYRDELAKGMRITHGGYAVMSMGALPKGLKKENVEANYMLLEDKNICVYTAIVNVDFHGWKLLKTGLYYDTLSREMLQEKYKELQKTLRFTIPFEKNKSQYNPEDLRPMYDSLQMTDYAIKTISIRAYTSVEGSYEKNESLQNARAQSIVSALQSFQTEKISSAVTASENWVEFLTDFSSAYPELTALNKEEIKEKLKSPALLSKLEPVLRRHRKAMVEIAFEKRLSYRESNPGELKNYFHQTIENKNTDEALYLQWIIFNKVERQEAPETFINDLKIPETLEWGGLLTNEAAFRFEQGYSNTFEAIQAFEKLDRLLPDNPRILYNLCALQLQSWVETDIHIEPISLKKDIEGLQQKGIHPNLVRRLMVNYYIIQTERSNRARKFADRDKALRSVAEMYKKSPMTDDDLVNLAKYFSHYSKFDWATRAIEPRIQALDVSEDLVFYYLSLTLYEEKNTKSASYRTMMLNAINSNRKRFCSLFRASEDGGISFQLLSDPYLKKTFCENCK